MSRLQAKSSFKRRGGHKGQVRRGNITGKMGIWPVRLIDGFRKILVGLFSFPAQRQPAAVMFQAAGDAPERPSSLCCCSSNLRPLNPHYDEAIADCVEFLNKSARDARPGPQF